MGMNTVWGGCRYRGRGITAPRAGLWAPPASVHASGEDSHPYFKADEEVRYVDRHGKCSGSQCKRQKWDQILELSAVG